MFFETQDLLKSLHRAHGRPNHRVFTLRDQFFFSVTVLVLNLDILYFISFVLLISQCKSFCLFLKKGAIYTKKERGHVKEKNSNGSISFLPMWLILSFS